MRTRARNAFPFTVQRGHNQPLWVEIYVPAETRPEGTTRARPGFRSVGRCSFRCRSTCVCGGSSLPSTSTLKSSFGLNGINALKQHRGSYTNDEDLRAITAVYTKAALLHRITTHGGSMSPPRFSQEAGKARLDWRAYDAEVGPFLNGDVIPAGEPLHGARVTSVEIRTPTRLRNRGTGKAVLDANGPRTSNRKVGETVYSYTSGMNRPAATSRRFLSAEGCLRASNQS